MTIFSFYRRTLALVFSLLTAVDVVFSQAQQLYNTTNGLSNTLIDHITFDQQGFMWVATEMGVANFDGESFTNYTSHAGDEHSLQVARALTVYIDTDDGHWIGTEDGLYSLNREDNCFTHYNDTRHAHISVASIVEHPLMPHTLLIGTYGQGVHCFDTQARQFNDEASARLNQAVGDVDSHFLFVDSHQRLWVFMPNWLKIIDLATMRQCEITSDIPSVARLNVQLKSAVEDQRHALIFFSGPEDGLFVADANTLNITHTPLPVSNVTSLALSSDGMLYVGTEGQGLWSYDPSSQDYHQLELAGPVDLNYAKVHCMTFDSQNNLWLGVFHHGLVKLPGQNNLFDCVPVSAAEGGSRNFACVSDFTSLPDGSRVYATDGEGIVIEHPDGSRSVYSRENSILPTNAIMAVEALPDGRVCVGTFRYGLFVIMPDGKLVHDAAFDQLNNVSVRDMSLDERKGMLYLSTHGMGIYYYDLASRRLGHINAPEGNLNWSTNVYVDSRGQVWARAARKLSCYDPLWKRFTDVELPSPSVSVSGFAEGANGQIWASSSVGLLRYDEKQHMFVNEMPDNSTYYSAILCSEDGKVWLSSTGSISVYDPRSEQLTVYKGTAISSAGSMMTNSAFRWDNGDLCFGADNGALTFSPYRVEGFKRPSSQIILKRLWVEHRLTDFDPNLSADDNVLDKALWCATELRLPASKASFSLSYSLIDHSSISDVAYSYRLVGYETSWHPSHDNRSVNYRSLPSGTYTLQIRAVQENGREEVAPMRELRVIILPPWYASAWAIVLWIGLTLLVGVVFYQLLSGRRLQRHQLAEGERLRQIKDAKLTMLTSVSHEIKTPLILIISPLRKMMMRHNDPATQSVLEVMYRNALRILMLVNQQMDVRKLSSGRLKLHVRELKFNTFLSEQMTYFLSSSLSRHVQFKLNLPEGLSDESFWADPYQIDKVIINLLANAFRHVPDGGTVTISVKESTIGQADAWRISIYNEGAPLTAERRQSIMAGVGYTLSCELMALHHGQLSLSEEADGVTFDVDLLKGHAHFSAEEMTEVATDPLAMLHAEVPEIVDAMPEPETAEKADEPGKPANEAADTRLQARKRLMSFDLDIPQLKLSTTNEKLLERVMASIVKNMGDSDFSVDALAEDVGLSRGHLNRKLKEFAGTSPSDLIKSVRLKQAAYLLVQGNVTVSEVAYSVGFTSPAYFASTFSQHYGMTPKEFMNNYNERPDSPELQQLLER